MIEKLHKKLRKTIKKLLCHTCKQKTTPEDGSETTVPETDVPETTVPATTYGKTPHTTTQQSPALLFLKRDIRTRLDLLKPDLEHQVQNKSLISNQNSKSRYFEKGQHVAIRDYGRGNDKWKFGKIVEQEGNCNYKILIGDELHKRHVDQMRKIGDQIKLTVPDQVVSFSGSTAANYSRQL
ncbi:hypothetical protein JTE90_020155 [Oedothorax gibbosus]|uniref:DUF5641 domain-containing protein n=1 Tax=Oedothorax gibbosus TaxID=931172 RepID=A0AAV6TS60_9ARAC|nr:hypothetical protein JTE90_020155 [Oedothorax gibbosus]